MLRLPQNLYLILWACCACRGICAKDTNSYKNTKKELRRRLEGDLEEPNSEEKLHLVLSGTGSALSRRPPWCTAHWLGNTKVLPGSKCVAGAALPQGQVQILWQALFHGFNSPATHLRRCFSHVFILVSSCLCASHLHTLSFCTGHLTFCKPSATAIFSHALSDLRKIHLFAQATFEYYGSCFSISIITKTSSPSVVLVLRECF